MIPPQVFGSADKKSANCDHSGILFGNVTRLIDKFSDQLIHQ
jgi:hypothetical protein